MTAKLEPDARLERLIAAALPGARIVGVTLLGIDSAPEGGTTKGAGYGAPLRIDLEREGQSSSVVLHTATKNQFGHDRRADRAAEALLAFDTFDAVPRHVRALDVGAFSGDSGFVSLRETGEFYLLSEWAEGTLYAESLRRIVRNAALEPDDLPKVDQLAVYLAELHAPREWHPVSQTRAQRDLFGSGEGIFGIIDSYPEPCPGLSAGRLRNVERLCCDWRWTLKARGRPLRRTHGDFHPFNLLFDENGRLRLLDTSRGSLGDAADDVTCLALNFPFFALERPEAWHGVLSRLWFRFWSRYLARSRDTELLDVAAPYLAWRGLVLANPVWYPSLSDSARSRLFEFLESTLEHPRFEPESVEQLFPR